MTAANNEFRDLVTTEEPKNGGEPATPAQTNSILSCLF